MVEGLGGWVTGERRQGIALALLLLGLTLFFMRGVLYPAPGYVLGGHDMRGAYYLWYETARQALRQGSLPLWDPYLSAGFPFAVNPHVGIFYPPTWLTFVLPINLGISWYAVFHIWLSAVGMMLFVRAMSGRWLGALLAAITFAFGGYLAGRLWAGHTIPLAVNAWLPWILLALYWAGRRPEWSAAVVAGLPLSMAILAGHVPSLLYVWLICGAFLLYWLFTLRPWHLLLRQALIAGLVAFGLSAVQLLPLLQFMVVSTRLASPTFEFATNYSLPLAHLITLVVPSYFGEPLRVGYWSVPTFEELTYYAGVLPLLALLLAVRRPTRLTWFYIVLIVTGLWLALGRESFLYRLFYDFLPPFRIVRAPARAAILYTFAASALLGEALATWQRLPAARRTVTLAGLMRWTLAVIAVAGVAALAATGAVFAAQHPTDTSGRLWHQLGGWSLALLLLLVGGGLLWAYLTAAPGGRRRPVLAGALVLLVTADVWFFSFKMVRLESFAPSALWQDAATILGESRQRVLPWGVPIFSQNEALQVGLRSVFGYNALEIAAVQDFVESVPDPRATTYDILGAAYTIAPVPLDSFSEGEAGLTLVDQTGAVWVYRRRQVLATARLVYEVELIADLAATIGRVHQSGFDPETTAILEQPPGCQVGPLPAVPASVHVIEERPGYWLIQTESASPGLLVLSESAYPGWQVTVGGQPATALTAYGVVRAVCVPAGTHHVEWRFAPTIFMVGGLITVPTLLVLLLAGVHLKRRREALPAPPVADEVAAI
jgi:hypothetical protein